jgi:hypothetical protein
MSKLTMEDIKTLLSNSMEACEKSCEEIHGAFYMQGCKTCELSENPCHTQTIFSHKETKKSKQEGK